jgi:predicted aminopeptidase
VAWLAILLPLSGCYLGHLAVHQVRLLRARQPIAPLLSDPGTPAELRAQLHLVGEARAYAARLGLAVGGQYTSYVEWPGDRIVTSVVATPPGSVEPAGFWFPIAGRVPYKGFFDAANAAAEASRLRAKGLDVCESAIPAYSTLGWLDDPVTTPMLRLGDGPLAETILHELVHATFYVPDQPDWNEGIASFIGGEASVRLFDETGRDAAERRAQVEDRRRVDLELLDLQRSVAELYAAQEPGPRREEMRRALAEASRERLGALPLQSLDAEQLAREARLNDACLALRGTYAGDLDRLTAVLERLDGDLEELVRRVAALSGSEDPLAGLEAGP